MNQPKPRDRQQDITTTADLEARMLVLEVVSMTAFGLAMDTSENADVSQARGIANLMLETVHQRCNEMGMSAGARLSANSYANELLSTALQSLYPNSPREH